MGVGTKPIGAVEVLNKQNGKPFNAEDRDLLQRHGRLPRRWRSTMRGMADQLVEQERLHARGGTGGSRSSASSLPPKSMPDRPSPGINAADPAKSPATSTTFFDLPDGADRLRLGDVSGKGLNASLLMAQAASLVPLPRQDRPRRPPA